MELKVFDREIVLQQLWQKNRLSRQELQTLGGKRVEIVYPGVVNLDAGPDFKDAVIKMDGRLLKGDVEIHMHPGGWYSHGHHLDPGYNRVVLHVISHGKQDEPHIKREDSVQVEQLIIEVDEERESDEPTAAETVTLVEACPLKEQPAEKVISTLVESGKRRLLERVEQFREARRRQSWEQILYANLLSALGYSKNQVPFRRLSELLPFEQLTEILRATRNTDVDLICEAVLFGASGLLQADGPGDKHTSAVITAHCARLQRSWNEQVHRFSLHSMSASEWQFFRLRPQNFPTRRIAGLVQIFLKFWPMNLWEGLLRIFANPPDKARSVLSELERVFIAEPQGFWLSHYHFKSSGHKPKGAETALIGRERARDIVVNIVLPLVYLQAVEGENAKLRNLVMELFARFPQLSENVVTRTMQEQLQLKKIGITRGGACKQQGLIHLHRMFCRPLRCEDCLGLTR